MRAWYDFVGQTYYPTVKRFIWEADRYGVSRITLLGFVSEMEYGDPVYFLATPGQLMQQDTPHISPQEKGFFAFARGKVCGFAIPEPSVADEFLNQLRRRGIPYSLLTESDEDVQRECGSYKITAKFSLPADLPLSEALRALKDAFIAQGLSQQAHKIMIQVRGLEVFSVPIRYPQEQIARMSIHRIPEPIAQRLEDMAMRHGVIATEQGSPGKMVLRVQNYQRRQLAAQPS